MDRLEYGRNSKALIILIHHDEYNFQYEINQKKSYKYL